jgi:hypothetical protein
VVLFFADSIYTGQVIWPIHSQEKVLMRIQLALGSIIMALALVACTNSGSQMTRGYEMKVRYAEITGINREPLPSVAPVGAIVGGFTGLLLSRNRSVGSQVASGVGGAALGGLATKALEGERLAYNYELRYMDGSLARFISEKGYLQKGDCVLVESGKTSNIRRVARTLCSPPESKAATAAPTPVEPAHVRDANQCHEAKEQLLAASGEEEINAAARKVEIICQY